MWGALVPTQPHAKECSEPVPTTLTTADQPRNTTQTALKHHLAHLGLHLPYSLSKFLLQLLQIVGRSPRGSLPCCCSCSSLLQVVREGLVLTLYTDMAHNRAKVVGIDVEGGEPRHRSVSCVCKQGMAGLSLASGVCMSQTLVYHGSPET